MCFHVAHNITREHLEKTYKLPYEKGDSKLGFFITAFSKPWMPIVCNGATDIKEARWGLIPEFITNQKDAEDISLKTFNAKAETIFEKPSFKPSAEAMHCVIPVNGFFEWQQVHSNKVPYYIRLKEHKEIMSLAGLYSIWTDPVKNNEIITFTIITVPANPLMEKIHNTHKRMPAILEDNDIDKWLNSHSIDETKNLLQSCDEQILDAYTISPRLITKNVDIHNPHIIKHYTEPQQGMLF